MDRRGPIPELQVVESVGHLGVGDVERFKVGPGVPESIVDLDLVHVKPVAVVDVGCDHEHALCGDRRVCGEGRARWSEASDEGERDARAGRGGDRAGFE